MAPCPRARACRYFDDFDRRIDVTRIFDHAERNGSLKGHDGAHQQRSLARPRAGNKVERQHALLPEVPAIGGGKVIIFGQKVAFDRDPTHRSHSRCMAEHRHVLMIVGVPMPMHMAVDPAIDADMLMPGRRFPFRCLARLFITATSACHAHDYSTSRATNLISMPPRACTW